MRMKFVILCTQGCSATMTESMTSNVISSKCMADCVVGIGRPISFVQEALIGVAFATGGFLMAKAMMAWFRLPSDLTLAEALARQNSVYVIH